MRLIIGSTLALILLSLFAQAEQTATVQGVVAQAPPPLKQERPRPRRPSPAFAWIDGYWSWRAGHVEWVRGHWAAPPRLGWQWEQARWAQVNGAWMYYEGHWSSPTPSPPLVAYEPQPAPDPRLVVAAEPPPLLIEARPEAPAHDAVWIPGYWHWNGARHVWVSGTWSAPRPGWEWTAPQWQRRSDGHWQFLPGHWTHG
jgi:hypothetical protein